MPDVLVDRDGPVTTITLHRPERRNAYTFATLVELDRAWTAADGDDGCRAIVVTGAGGAFCAGMDLRALAGGEAAPDPAVVDRATLKRWRPRQPIVAAVEGPAVAGGCELLLATDVRVAGETARMGVAEARWGLYPGGGGAVRLARQLPPAVAAELLLTGRLLGADEALRHGLVGRVVPDGEALAAALELAHAIAANGPVAVAALVRTLRETVGMPEAEAFAHEQPILEGVFASDDAREGPAAFAEGRPPRFTGR